MDAILLIQDLAVILVAAAVLGYICRKLGLSPILGYLVAGLIIGTPEVAFPYVSDEDRLTAISQLGLIFLMFSIGLQFRLSRIKELGIGVVLATLITALLVFSSVRIVGNFLGFAEEVSLCIAALFMVSSSAIIGKVIDDSGLGHERSSRIALGMTLLEDIVAVVMLTIVSSYIAQAESGSVNIPTTVGLVIGFALILVVSGLFFFPRLLNRTSSKASDEFVTILLTGVLLTVAITAAKSGYSMALGSFLFGVVISETRQSNEISKNFRALKDVFLTTFFVAIGMQVDVFLIPEVIHWILLGSFLALTGRALASFIALVTVSENPRVSFCAAVSLTPIGEFSFIIAGLAVAGGLMNESFQVIAVGVAMITSLISPLLISKSSKIADKLRIDAEPPKVFHAYQRFWSKIHSVTENSLRWIVIRKRLSQILFEIALISAFLVFSMPFADWLLGFISQTLEREIILSPLLMLLAILAIIIPPVISVVRNIDAALALLMEFVAEDYIELRNYTKFLHLMILFGSLSALFLWFWNLVPQEGLQIWTGLAALLLLAIITLVFWRKMIRVHSQWRITLSEAIQEDRSIEKRLLSPMLSTASWNLQIKECTLPEETNWAGRTVKDTLLRSKTGASIVGIERHGYRLHSLGPNTHLFPGDIVLLMGNAGQIEQALNLLGQKSDAPLSQGSISDVLLESCIVEPGSAWEGKSLQQLNLPLLYHVQAVGIVRAGKKIANPQLAGELLVGDKLLLLGVSADLKELKSKLA